MGGMVFSECLARASRSLDGGPAFRPRPLAAVEMQSPYNYSHAMLQAHAPLALRNRGANRPILALLRSSLHSVSSGRPAVITVTCRRTGHEHSFPVSYERSGERVRIPALWPERKIWWRNLRDGGAAVRLMLGGLERTGLAEAIEDPGGTVSVALRLDKDTRR